MLPDLELDRAWTGLQTDPDYLSLVLNEAEAEQLRAEAEWLVDNYFALEDPNDVRPVGIELPLEATVGPCACAGSSTGSTSPPTASWSWSTTRPAGPPPRPIEQSKLIGVHIYALLCQEVLGRRPAQVRLLHLKEPIAITAEPSEQAVRGQRMKTLAVWSAIERACHDEDFRPRTSPLCRLLPLPGVLPCLRR